MMFAMSNTQDAQLSGWDWRADLRRQERSIPWLARRTGVHQNTVYRYAWGTRKAPPAWLVQASKALGKD